jgi:hypothetical protein
MVADSFNPTDKIEKKALVVSCYNWEWQKVLTIEGAWNLREMGYSVEYLDLSGFKSNPLKTLFKSILGRTESHRQRKKFLRVNGIQVNHPTVRIATTNLTLLLGSIFGFCNKSNLKDRWNVVYPGLVELTGNVNVSPEKNEKLVRKILLGDKFFVKLLASQSHFSSRYDLVLVVNGRFPLNRAATHYFKEKNQEVRLIEFGSSREKFEIYRKSPHSVANRRELLNEFIRKSDISNVELQRVSSAYFEERRRFDKQANIRWTRWMKNSQLPYIDPSKKICTFFPTSEKEFAGVSDVTSFGEFANQFEALEALITSLGPQWDVFIRRHPKATDDDLDPEFNSWASFESYKNVHIIQPQSEIDSYKLGMKSDLVAHYSSFIGPELIYAGHKFVITLGPTPWEDLDPLRHLRSPEKLARYLRNQADNSAIPDLSLLGYYMATFGRPFFHYRWEESKKRWELREEQV